MLVYIVMDIDEWNDRVELEGGGCSAQGKKQKNVSQICLKR